MKHVMMSVYDSKARVYNAPFFVSTLDVGVRAFEDCANNPEHAFFRHPDDYTLVLIGHFDDDTGAVELKPQIVQIGLAGFYKRSFGGLKNPDSFTNTEPK